MSINTDIGTATANSYVSVGFANTYFQERTYSDSWSNLSINSTGTLGTTERKERILKQATREIDYNLRFHEGKYYTGYIGATGYQILQFPRRSNIDSSGNLYIPTEVKDATCEQALWILERGGKKIDKDGAVIQKQTIGDVTLEYLKPWINRNVESVGRFGWQRG